MEISVDEFETFAINRLIVLRKIEQIKFRGQTQREDAEDIRKELHQYLQWRSDAEHFDSDKRK